MDKSFNTNCFSLFVLLSTSLVLISCSSIGVKRQYDYIGLYEIIERECEVAVAFLDDCKNTKFIELVKGQFSGVKNNETAIVFWRGDKSEELLYHARKIQQLLSVKNLRNNIIISNTDTESEFLKFDREGGAEYSLTINRQIKGKPGLTKIQYKLKPVKRGLLPEYRMNYPGSD
jgi:hypothetical protein